MNHHVVGVSSVNIKDRIIIRINILILGITRKSYAANHFLISIAYNNIDAISDKLNWYEETLKEAYKTIEIGRYTYLSHQPEMRMFENSLDARRSKVSQLFDNH